MTPISRRSFLAGGAAALGGWALLPAAGHGAETADPNRFVLMADTHVCADRNAREHDCNPDETFQQAVRDILELTPRPAGLIVAGDCVYLQGRRADYEALAEFLQPLRGAGIPVLLALGNHDNRENFQAVFPDAAILKDGALKDRKCAVIATPHADWHLLDSLQKTDYTPGRFGAEQLDLLAARLDKAPARPALLLAHHPLRKQPDDGGLEDTGEFLKVVADRKQVKAYFFGHSHAWSVKQREDGMHLINLPANAWLFDEAKPRGFVDAHLLADGCELTLHCLDRKDPRHGEKHALPWRSA